jgi:hypothetical protein
MIFGVRAIWRPFWGLLGGLTGFPLAHYRLASDRLVRRSSDLPVARFIWLGDMA